jgi:hypothetical protein
VEVKPQVAIDVLAARAFVAEVLHVPASAPCAGLSYDRIARALEAEGILSPAGRPTWQASTVRRIYQSAMAATGAEQVGA